MDGTSAPPSSSTNSAATAGGASKFLFNLPSRGLLSSAVLSSNPGGIRVYICDHDTSPPEDQLIKTNQTNILIRSLMLKKQKGDVKGVTANDATKKRAAERATDGKASAKRAMTSSQTGSRQEGSRSHPSDRNYQNLTVERLRALLKEKGLSPKGKKDELIARLQSING